MSANRPEMCLVLLTLLRLSLEEIKSGKNITTFLILHHTKQKIPLGLFFKLLFLGLSVGKKISFDLWPFF